jgi:hypothetical protein
MGGDDGDENSALQTKLVVGAPNDPYEQQADRMAEAIVPSLQKQNSEEEELQTKPLASLQAKLQLKGDTPQVSDQFESILNRSRSGGHSIPDGLRGQMQTKMGADFSGVRLHTDSTADMLSRSVQARAFTTGQDIFFKAGEYNPTTTEGQKLLVHESTHVMQQNPSLTQPQIQRLIDSDEFKKQTREGLFAGRGPTLKAIEKLLDEYHALKIDPLHPPYPTQLQILAEILEHTKNYLINHEGDKSRKKRTIAMGFFQQLVEYEIETIERKKNKIDKILGDNEISEEEKKKVAYSANDRGGKLDDIKEKFQGTAKSALEKAGFLIKMAVPNPGDKSKLEMELKIPVDPSGVGFLGARLLLQTERGKVAQYKVRCEFTVTGGAKIGSLAEVKGELGVFMELQAESAEKAMQLVSYALYRRFVESKVMPAEMSNFLWGGATSIVGYRKAEKWAGNVEKEVFGGASDPSKTYVDTGLLGGASGSMALTDKVGGKIGIKATLGTRIDKEAIQTGKLVAELGLPQDLAAEIAGLLGKHFTKKKDLKKANEEYESAQKKLDNATEDTRPALQENLNKISEKRQKAEEAANEPLDKIGEIVVKSDLDDEVANAIIDAVNLDKENAFLGMTHEYEGRGDAQRRIGKNMTEIEISGEIAALLFKLGAKGKILFVSGANREESIKLSEISAELVGTASFTIGKDIGSEFANLTSSVVTGLSNFLRRMATQKKSKDVDAASYAGILMSASTQVGFSAQNLVTDPSTLKDPLAKTLKPIEQGFKLGNSVGMNLTGKYKYEKGGKHSVEISLNNVETIGIGQNLPGLDLFSLKNEKISRIATLKWETGKGWAVNPELA